MNLPRGVVRAGDLADWLENFLRKTRLSNEVEDWLTRLCQYYKDDSHASIGLSGIANILRTQGGLKDKELLSLFPEEVWDCIVEESQFPSGRFLEILRDIRNPEGEIIDSITIRDPLDLGKYQ